MNRFIQVPAGGGMANWLAGYGEEQKRVHAVEAQMQAAADSQLGQNIGQGIGNFATGYVARKNRLDDAATAHNYNMVEQAGRFAGQQQTQDSIYNRQMDLENLRSGNDILEKTWAEFIGQPKTSSSNGGYQMSPFMGNDAPVEQGIGTNMDGSVMMPEQSSPEPTVPSPSIDPGMTAQHRKAQDEYDGVQQAGMRIYSDPNMPVQDKAAAIAALVPAKRQAAFMLQGQSRPKPPSSEEELIQSGVVVPSKNGGNWYQSAPGKWSFANPPKDEKDTTSPPPQTPEETEMFIAKHVPNVAALRAKGYDFVVQPDGKKIEIIKPEKEEADKKDDIKPIDYTKYRAQAQKELTRVEEIEGGGKKTIYPSDVELTERTEKLIKEASYASKSPEDQRKQTLASTLKKMKADFPGGYATMPPNQQAQYNQFIAEYRSLVGDE